MNRLIASVMVTFVGLAGATPAHASSGAKEATGALIELRSKSATFVPTSDDGLQGVLVMPAPKATFDHDPSDGDATRLPALRATASLRDQPTVEAVLRRPGASASEDAYGLTLSDITYTKVAGFSATAAVQPSVDAELLDDERRGLDGGRPPVDLGAVALSAADTNVRASASNRPAPPGSGDDYTVYMEVTNLFPSLATFVFTPRNLHCAKAANRQVALSSNQSESVPIEIETGGDCGWDFSTALWDVSIQPTGTPDLDKLWVYMHVDQYGPLMYSTRCETVNQPNRPRCTSHGAFNDNVVKFTVGIL